jgi:hypothetical protein
LARLQILERPESAKAVTKGHQDSTMHSANAVGVMGTYDKLRGQSTAAHCHQFQTERLLKAAAR